MISSKHLSIFERTSLAIFLGCMIVTATIFIVSIWTQHEIESIFMLAGTLVIIGLANFLIWLPIILYRIVEKR